MLRAERLEKLKATRKVEQIKYNRESVSIPYPNRVHCARSHTECWQIRTRHSNMLARAHFLSTKTEPKLVRCYPPICDIFEADGFQYYKPWELVPEEESRIKGQISDVEFLIERELAEFDKLYPEEPNKEAPVPEEEINTSSKETVGEPRAESPPNPNTDIDPTNPPAQDPPSDQTAVRKHSLGEHNGEVVVEADEDTVIY